MLLHIGVFYKSLDKQETRSSPNVWKTLFTLSGFQGECPHLVTVPVLIMWPGVFVQSYDSLAQQHKPLALNDLP